MSFKKTSITDTDTEISRVHQALSVSVEDLKAIQDNAKGSLDEDTLAIFDAHIAILSDPEMIKQIDQEINDKKVNAEQALTKVTTDFANTLAAMTDNQYMQERAADVKDVSKRVLSHLLGKKLPDLAAIDSPVIIVAHEVTPSDTSQMNKKNSLRE